MSPDDLLKAHYSMRMVREVNTLLFTYSIESKLNLSLLITKNTMTLISLTSDPVKGTKIKTKRKPLGYHEVQKIN